MLWSNNDLINPQYRRINYVIFYNTYITVRFKYYISLFYYHHFFSPYTDYIHIYIVNFFKLINAYRILSRNSNKSLLLLLFRLRGGPISPPHCLRFFVDVDTIINYIKNNNNIVSSSCVLYEKRHYAIRLLLLFRITLRIDGIDNVTLVTRRLKTMNNNIV